MNSFNLGAFTAAIKAAKKPQTQNARSFPEIGRFLMAPLFIARQLPAQTRYTHKAKGAGNTTSN
ncbi:hypothetical protein [Aeromonas sobria]|uniref:hypothetical protein n=1 Tax=Aeromonas sobria TaxID=646 RepID=UPI0026F1ABE9|nr:hypothetical protein [Aeromonas sobria]